MPNYFPEIDPVTGDFLSPLVQDAIDARAAAAGSVGHNHDDHYYTETESDLRFVRTVNGAGPDGSGNVAVEAGSAVDDLDDVPDSATRVAMTTAERAKLGGIATGAEVNVNADWDAATGDAQILNKPTIPPAPPSATTTVQGIVELATTAETTAGTDAVRAVTPLGLKAVADTKQAAGSYAPAGHTHDDRYYTETEADGRFVRTVNGAGPDGAGNVTVAGEGGSTVTDATASTKGVVQLAGDLGGTADAPTVPGLAGKANTGHGHAVADVTGLQVALDGKQAAGSYAATGRAISAGTGLTGGGDLSADRSLAVDFGQVATAAQGAKADSASQPGHTHTLDQATDTATRLAMTTAERAKLGGVATSATANATDAALRDRSTHTGTQPSSTISDSTAVGRSLIAAVDAAAARSAVGAAWRDSAVLDVREFGAVLGTTSAAAAANVTLINAAIAEAVATNKTLVFGRGAPQQFLDTTGYWVNETIDIPGGLDVRMDSAIIYAGPAGTPAIRYNPTGGVAYGASIKLRVERATQASWADEADAGIILRNLTACEVRIAKVRGFTVGVVALGDNQGFVYNEISLGYLSNNRYHLDLYELGTGWTNENLWLGGNFRNDSSTHPTLSRYGIRIGRVGGYSHNGNSFIKPSLELNVGTSPEAVPVLCQGARDNSFKGCRHELNSDTFLRETGASTRNHVELLFEPNIRPRLMIDSQGQYGGSTILTTPRSAPLADVREVYSVTDAARKAVAYDATNVNIPGLSLGSSGNANVVRQTANLTLNPGYVEIGSGRCVGFFVDTRLAKHFLTERMVEPGFGGRFLVRCYDAAGAVIPHDPEVMLVRAEPQVTQNATWGGVYTTGSDSEGALLFQLAESVASIWIGLARQSTNIRFNGLKLYAGSASGTTSAWTGFPENAVDPVAVQAPTFGTYTVGRRVMHGAPAVGDPQGWVCTAAGTPGTWKPFGAVDPTVQAINAQTGTSYTLTAADAGKRVHLTNASPITLNVPGGVFTAGQRIDVLVLGAGMVTVAGVTGATVEPIAKTSRAQYSAFSVVFNSPTSAVLVGDLA